MNRRITEKIDYIFLTNNTLDSIGGLPFLLKMNHVKDAKIYATTPIAKLGFYILADAYISTMEITDKFKSFTDSDISSAFLNLNEVKFKENVKLPHNNSEILITPLPSGTSLGGCCWKINYKLHSVLYAPNMSIDYKYICDAFPYDSIKNIDVVVTDSKYSNKISLVKTVIESEFKKNILDSIDKGKNIFIPSDTANINIELLIRIEKILDEYYFNKTKEIPGEKKELPYKVLLCGYSSNEVVESVKSLIEFLGSSISQQFYSYNENPFNLQYVQCLKDVKEFQTIKSSNNVIIISSFESLDRGFTYKILPEILPDPNFRILIVNRSHKHSLLRDILRKLKGGVNEYNYKEIKRVLDTSGGITSCNSSIPPVNFNSNINTNIIPGVKEINQNTFITPIINDSLLKPHDHLMLNTQITQNTHYTLSNITSLVDRDINHVVNVEKLLSLTAQSGKVGTEGINLNMLSSSDLSIKKKLFAKSPHPMFAYHQKKKINDYGVVKLENKYIIIFLLIFRSLQRKN